MTFRKTCSSIVGPSNIKIGSLQFTYECFPLKLTALAVSATDTRTLDPPLFYTIHPFFFQSEINTSKILFLGVLV